MKQYIVLVDNASPQIHPVQGEAHDALEKARELALSSGQTVHVLSLMRTLKTRTVIEELEPHECGLSLEPAFLTA